MHSVRRWAFERLSAAEEQQVFVVFIVVAVVSSVGIYWYMRNRMR